MTLGWGNWPINTENGWIDQRGGYDKYEKSTRILDLLAEVIRFDDKHVVCNVEMDAGIFECREFDLDPFFIGLYLFVGMKVNVIIKTAPGWTECAVKYTPSVENVIIPCS